VKLLYVTPEQLVKSDSLRGLLQDLRQRQLLARFVIDEVSQSSEGSGVKGLSKISVADCKALSCLVDHSGDLPRLQPGAACH
jgi:hypothetical protein